MTTPRLYVELRPGAPVRRGRADDWAGLEERAHRLLVPFPTAPGVEQEPPAPAAPSPAAPSPAARRHGRGWLPIALPILVIGAVLGSGLLVWQQNTRISVPPPTTVSQAQPASNGSTSLAVKTTGSSDLLKQLPALSESWVIVVNVPSNELYLFRGGKWFRTYKVSTGKPSEPTPINEWIISEKTTQPGAQQFGPRWMRLSKFNGETGRYDYTDIGIHGTDEEEKLGTGASQGCVRMANEDVREVFDAVPIGTVVITMKSAPPGAQTLPPPPPPEPPPPPPPSA